MRILKQQYFSKKIFLTGLAFAFMFYLGAGKGYAQAVNTDVVIQQGVKDIKVVKENDNTVSVDITPQDSLGAKFKSSIYPRNEGGVQTYEGCGDGICFGSFLDTTPDPDVYVLETAASCPQDCSDEVCGNGTCGPGEDSDNCPGDCPLPTCGEAGFNCSGQCGVCGACSPCCGDGTCNGAETNASCSQDCPAGPVCGNGTCEAGELCSSCSQDCGTCPPRDPTDGVDG